LDQPALLSQLPQSLQQGGKDHFPDFPAVLSEQWHSLLKLLRKLSLCSWRLRWFRNSGRRLGFQRAGSSIPDLVLARFRNAADSGNASAEKQWLDSFSADATVEDLYLNENPTGIAGVRAYLENKSGCGRLVIDRCSDGDRSCGFTWHLQENEAVGLRGTTFVQLDEQGKVCYLREICEPLFKPGDLTVELLKAIGGDNVATFDQAERREPKGASDICRYLWKELQGNAPPKECLTFFADKVLYEDFNYELPLRGKEEVGDFLEKFAKIKALKFVAERFSDGSRACCFTWNVEIVGAPEDAPRIKGISFYELNDAGKITYVRDIPESSNPFQGLVAMAQPKLRVLLPRSSVVAGEERCNCADAGGVVWPTGECVDGQTVLDQMVTGSDGVRRSVAEQIGGARGAVVIYLRHLA